MGNEVVLISRIPELVQALRAELGKVAKDTATEVVNTYRETAARETGYMASSGYVVTKDSSTYGQGLEGHGPPLLPEVDRPTEDTEAIAAIAAPYAADVELGTRFMAAQPAYFPAVDKAASSMAARAQAIEQALRGLSLE